MKQKILGVVMLSGAIALSAQAADTKPAARRACVYAQLPDSWRVLDSQHLVIWAPGRQAYVLELMTPLPDLPSAQTLAFNDDDHDGQICSGDKLSVPGPGGLSSSTFIAAMHHADDDELRALSEQYHVRLLPKSKDKPHDKQAHE